MDAGLAGVHAVLGREVAERDELEDKNSQLIQIGSDCTSQESFRALTNSAGSQLVCDAASKDDFNYYGTFFNLAELTF